MPLRAGGSKPPLFLAHGVSGLLFRYVHLVDHLDPEQPVYGLQPTMQSVDDRTRLRIPDLATRYVEDIVRIQPHGPYRLAGFCFGGIVVLEVAHQLEQRGHTVAVLALFAARGSLVFTRRGGRTASTMSPTSPHASRPRREVAQLASVVRGHESVTAYVRRRRANASVKAQRWRWLADDWLHARTGRTLASRWDDVERMQSPSPLWRALRRSMRAYTVPTTKCSVTFFRGGAPTADVTGVRFVPGNDGAGEYVIDGPGVSHETLMAEPHVARARRRAGAIARPRRPGRVGTAGRIPARDLTRRLPWIANGCRRRRVGARPQ